jgi:hypothetical protein
MPIGQMSFEQKSQNEKERSLANAFQEMKIFKILAEEAAPLAF